MSAIVKRIRKMFCLEDGRMPEVVVGGVKMLNFCSNNYLGLTMHPKIIEAGKRALEKYGAGAGSARFISGTMAVHCELEERLAAFEGREAAVLFPSGYMANLGTISALCSGSDAAVICDRLNHASIIDAIRLSGAKLLVYPHCDTKKLESVLERADKYGFRLVVTDSVFSMDGDFAPLKEISRLCREHAAMFMTDEAHATGLLGNRGRGLCEAEGLGTDDVRVKLGTLSKALGCAGGFISGEKELMERIRNTARSFIYTTAPAPAVCACAIAALDVLDAEGDGLRAKLNRLVQQFRAELGALGIPDFGSRSHIVPLVCGTEEKTRLLAEAFNSQKILATPIMYPTVPKNGGRVRLTLTAAHGPGDIEKCLDVIKANKHLLKKEQ